MDIENLRDNGYFWIVIWIVQLIMYRLFFHNNRRGTLYYVGQAQMFLLMLVTCVCYGPTFIKNVQYWDTLY